jgi:hypothetical protein
MTVLITLTTAGTDTGPFNLYSNVDGYVSAFETGVSKAALLAGYSSALVPNGTTIIRIKSTGTCVNYIDVTVVTTTTTTTTSTPTTTTTTTSVPPTTTTTTTTSLVSNIFLDMSLSLDTTVSGISVQGSPASYVSGVPLPNTGGGNTNLNTVEVGGAQTVVITYTCTFGGHKITLIDSLGTVTCQNTSIGSGITMTFINANINNITAVQIIAEDGTC